MSKMFLTATGIVVVSAVAALHWHAGAAEGPVPAAAVGADEKAPQELIDALKKIASGDLAVDRFDFSVSCMTGLVGTQFKVGDVVPNTQISIHKGAVTVVKSVVSALRQVESVSVPTFSTHAIVVDATEAELRRIAGMVVEADVGAPVKGFSWKDGEKTLRADVTVDGKSGTLKLNLLKPEENKRAEELLKLLKDFNGRPEKVGGK
jgi:hypothetical protein